MFKMQSNNCFIIHTSFSISHEPAEVRIKVTLFFLEV